jgi:hypothetical protein
MRPAQIELFQGVAPVARPVPDLSELLATAIELWPERGNWHAEPRAVVGRSVVITDRGAGGLSGSAWARDGGRQVIEDNRLSARELVAELRASTMTLATVLRELSGCPWAERIEGKRHRWRGPWHNAGWRLSDRVYLIACRAGRTTRITCWTEPEGAELAAWEVARGRLVGLDLSPLALARHVRRADPGGVLAVSALTGWRP